MWKNKQKSKYLKLNKIKLSKQPRTKIRLRLLNEDLNKFFDVYNLLFKHYKVNFQPTRKKINVY